MSLGKGSMVNICQKQKFNTRSLTEAELVSVDDYVERMEWTMRFLQTQGYDTKTELHQDNRTRTSSHLNQSYLSGQLPPSHCIPSTPDVLLASRS